MTQTLALLVDAYRELNAKWLFWITLILSGAFIGAFALLGFNARGLTLAGHQFDVPASAEMYTPIFSQVVIGFWLTWVATILALVSTAGIFPDLISSGTVDLYLARPISRLRLFLTKYCCGLLFVALQAIVFSVGSFLVMGLRGHIWMPSLFLAIPLVLLLFSYLFAFCVLLGVWTRSTIAALLLTIVAWGAFSAIQQTEGYMLIWRRSAERHVEVARQTITDADAHLEHFKQYPTDDIMGLEAGIWRIRREKAVNELPDLERSTHLPRTFHQVAYALRLMVPKTKETTDLLDRWLITDTQATGRNEQRERRLEEKGRGDQADTIDAAVEVEGIKRHRPVGWIVGTSLVDEAICIGLAAWLFCRRDY